jgi:hypothetical protein
MSRILLTLLIVIIILFVVIGAVLVYLSFAPISPSTTGQSFAATSSNSTSTPDENAISAVVTNFGLAEQKVALLAPDATSTIATDYGSYVTPELLSSWEASPQSASGRVASSPWPDHITVNSIRQTAQGYEVTGSLVLMSSPDLASGGNDGTDPVLIDLVNQNGKWLISSYQDQSHS